MGSPPNAPLCGGSAAAKEVAVSVQDWAAYESPSLQVTQDFLLSR